MSDPVQLEIPDWRMTVEEFLAWYEAQPKEAGHFELWDGHVVCKQGPTGSMNAERAKHRRIKSLLFVALRDAVRIADIEANVEPDGATVLLPGGQSVEPDALVYVGERVDDDSITIPNPVIVCEVLSPSTAKTDMSTKLEGYFTLPSIQHYLIADPDKPLIIVHSRESGNLLSTRLVGDPGSHLRLDPPGLDIDLSEILGR
jgi:Uma2 family endonuclease